jgi:SHS2 domain-containing protein
LDGATRPQRPDRGWEHFEHVADIGVHGFGPDVDTAFEQAALAMSAVVTDPDSIRVDETVNVRCRAPDVDILLADWLNAIVFEMATRGMLFGDFHVRIEGQALEARIGGEKVDRARHEPAAEVKGATFSELQVRREDDGLWHARCVVDV